jgi:argininosuccinate lyase
MPQKRNPDVLELIRGKAARAMASLQHLLILVKGLPMAYNRDLQEDKIALFDAHDTISACLELAEAIVSGAELQTERINERIEEGFLDATALMEYLIKRDVPMRTGHEIVGKLVAECESKQCRLSDMTLVELQQFCDKIEENVFDVLGTANAAAALCSFGSGGAKPVADQLDYWQNRIKSELPHEPESGRNLERRN